MYRADIQCSRGTDLAGRPSRARLPRSRVDDSTVAQRPRSSSNAIRICWAWLYLLLAACTAGPVPPAASRHGDAATTTNLVPGELRTVELAALAGGWSAHWTMTGAKTEPTYVENVRVTRRGNLFTLDADINGVQVGRTQMSVDNKGRVKVLACPRGSSCAERPRGFLATVEVLAVIRRGQTAGTAPVFPYADREVACVAAHLIWRNRPATRPDVAAPDAGLLLDPCLDTLTGAVVAQRSRYDGSFTGPTLDESSLAVRDLSAAIDWCRSGRGPHAGPR